MFSGEMTANAQWQLLTWTGTKILSRERMSPTGHFAAHRRAAVSSNPRPTKAAIRCKKKEEKKCDRLRAVTEATAALFSARNMDRTSKRLRFRQSEDILA